VIDGSVEPGWELLREAFEATLLNSSQSGASLAVYVDGLPTVDLWGGLADARTLRPWTRDTVACVFSASKGITAIAVHLLLQRGLLELDAPVARYWPEFAAAGKQHLTVRWLLTHQAGLPYVDCDLTLDDLRHGMPLLRALENQTPLWEPGTAVGYHAVTYGPLLGQLVRRVTGSSLSQFLAMELAKPLRANLWLGLSEDLQLDLAYLDPASVPSVDPTMFGAEFEETVRAHVVRGDRAIALGSALPAALVTGEPGDFNDRRVLALELGGSNLVTDARSLAKVYAATVSEVGGVRLLDDATVADCVALRTVDAPTFGIPAELAAVAPKMDFGLGFMNFVGRGPSAFGHPGAGGSLAFADVEARLAFAFVPRGMNAAGPVEDLIQATRACL
jgi:CubicO group peptidase (beta-lactamase class C family)